MSWIEERMEGKPEKGENLGSFFSFFKIVLRVHERDIFKPGDITITICFCDDVRNQVRKTKSDSTLSLVSCKV